MHKPFVFWWGIEIIENNINFLFKLKLNKNENKEPKILLSLSGGVDSVVLLDLVNKKFRNSKVKIYLLHVNYKVHKLSDEAELLCKKLAVKYNNKLILRTVVMDGKNFEHKARLYRYNILYKYAEIYNINTILTAHHYDDQIETLFMMKYIYKASWVSMMGIRENNNKLSRPLLKIKKDELYKYANKNNLLWIEDETNKDIKFLRNI